MKPLRSDEIRGSWATLLLPLNADDSIDYGLLASELDSFAAVKVSGVYSNGSAGEFYTQSEAEFDLVNELLATICEKAGIAFQIGASHMSPQISRVRLRRSKALKPSAFQVTLPDWFVPSWSEIIAFLDTMAAEAAPIPLILYNPPHAKRRLLPEEWLGIAEAVPGVVGMKVPGGDAGWYRTMQPVLSRLSVFIPGHTLASGLSRGALGAYSNVACLSPAGAQRWYELCIADPAAGLALETRILSFWQAHVAPLITGQGLANMAADKATAAAGGWLPGLSPRLRWPYRGASAETITKLAAAARAALPEWFLPSSSD